MRMNRRHFLGAAMASAALPMFGRTAFADAARSGTLRYGLSSFPPHLKAWVNGGAAQGVIKMLTQRALVSYDLKGNLQGEIADKFYLDDKGSWVFHLRPNVVFQNGKPLTVEDVKWTIEQVAAPKSPALLAEQFSGLDKVEIIDKETVRVVMKVPSPIVPNWLAAREMPIVAEGSSEDEPVSCGPFRIEAQERGTSYDLVAFDKYYKPGLPKLEAIKVTVYRDEALRTAALEAGDVDFIDSVPWQSMDEIEKDARLRIDIMSGAYQMLQFNGSQGPLADVRVRHAIGFAIRREEIGLAAFFGRGAPLGGLPIVEGTPWYDDKLAHSYSYDPAKAKALLAEAGVPSGFKTTILSTSQTGFEKAIAQLVQQHLGEIGIEATLNLPDQNTRNTLRARGQFEIFCGGSVAIDTDPDSIVPSLLQSPGIDITKTKAAVAKGRSEMTLNGRVAAYKEMQQAVFDEAPMIGLAWRTGGYAMDKKVKGFANLPGPLLRNSDYTFEWVSLG